MEDITRRRFIGAGATAAMAAALVGCSSSSGNAASASGTTPTASNSAAIDTMSLVIADVNLKDHLQQILREIKRDCNPKTVELQSNMALIATVGKGMVRSIGTAAKLFNALFEAGINIRMIDQGSSEMNIIVGVENEDFPGAVRAIYKAFSED